MSRGKTANVGLQAYTAVAVGIVAAYTAVNDRPHYETTE